MRKMSIVQAVFWPCVIWVSMVCLPACSEGTPPPETKPTIQMLPDEFYGAWERTGTSGGIDGQGVPEAEGARAQIVLERGNVLERQGPQGTTTRERFIVRRQKTIFSAEDRWTIILESGSMVLVLQLAPDGSLGMSENVYDGYSSSYRRGRGDGSISR